MSGHKVPVRRIRILPMLLVILLCACSAPERMDSAIDLLEAGQVNSSNPNYTLASLERRELSREFSSQGTFAYLADAPLFFEESGRLVQTYVTNYSQVSKGDILAEIECDQSEVRTEIALLTVSMERQEEKMRLERVSHRLDVDNLNRQLKIEMEKVGRDILRLRLKQRDISLAQAESSHKQTMDNLRRELAEQEARLGTIQLLAPFDGIVYAIRSAQTGIYVEKDEVVARVYDPELCLIRINADRRSFYLNKPVTIDLNKTDSIPGIIVSSPSDKTADLSAEFYIKPLEPVPGSHNVSGRTATVRSRVSVLTNVLPSRAIGKEDGKEYVSILEDGIVKRRYVKTGFTNMTDTEILYGLDGSEQVLVS